MKTNAQAVLVAVALVLGFLRVASAENAKFRFLAAVYFDEKGTGLNRPEGIACDDKGRVVVADTGNDRVLRFTYLDKTISGGAEIKIPELSAPSRVRLNSKGEIYALDGMLRRVVHLAADGTFKNVVSFDGAPPPTTVIAKSFALDDADTVYVLDALSARVLIVDASGQFQRALPLPPDVGFVSDLAVDAQGRVLLLDSIGRRVYAAAKAATAFAPLAGDLTATLTTLPSAIAASKGTIFIVEGGGDIVSIGMDGSFLARQLTEGRNEGSLQHPSQMCFTDKDEMLIADRDNSRVQVFGVIR